MPVTNVTKDLDTATLTITAEFAVPVERVWSLYLDPRQLEKIWGPPGFPATFVEHPFTVGSRSTYYMTGPDGEKYAGWWRMTEVDEPHSFSFTDGFADEDFNEDPNLPVSENTYSFAADGTNTIATYTTVYPSAAELQQVLDMGMEEGSRAAINQIDDFLVA